MKLPRVDLRSDEGAIAPLVAILLVVLLGFVAIGVDMGYLYVERTQLQQGVDAAALAGAQEIGVGDSGSMAAAYAASNGIAGGEITANQSASAYAAGDAWTVSAQRQASTFFAPILGLGSTSPVGATATAVKSPAKTAKVMPYGLWAGNISGPYTVSGSLVTSNDLEYRGNQWTNLVTDNPNPCGGKNQPTCHWNIQNGNKPSSSFKGFLYLQNNQDMQIFMTVGTTITANSKNGNNNEKDPSTEICNYVNSGQPALFPLLDWANDDGSGVVTFQVVGFRALLLDPISGCGGSNGMGSPYTGHPAADQSFVVSGLGGGSTPTNVYVLQLWQ